MSNHIYLGCGVNHISGEKIQSIFQILCIQFSLMWVKLFLRYPNKCWLFFSTFRKGLFLTPCIHSMIVQFKDRKTTCDCYKSVFGKYECLDVLLLLGVFIAYKLHFTHVGQVIDRTLIVWQETFFHLKYHPFL